MPDNSDPLMKLPKEVLKLVLSFLRVHDLTTMMQTSQNYKRFIEGNLSQNLFDELDAKQKEILNAIKDKISIYDTTDPKWQPYPVRPVNAESLINQLYAAKALTNELTRQLINILGDSLELTEDLIVSLLYFVSTGNEASIIKKIDDSKNIRKTQLLENREYNEDNFDPENILYGNAETDAENLKFVLCELIKLRKIKEVIIKYTQNLENVNQPETNATQLKL